MDLTLTTNGWSVLSLFILCWCLVECIKNISFGITVTRTVKHMKDIPNNQREIILDNLFTKKMKEMAENGTDR